MNFGLDLIVEKQRSFWRLSRDAWLATGLVLVAIFFASSLAYYHVKIGGERDPHGMFQALVVGLYRLLGFVPSFFLALLVLVWSSLHLVMGSVPMLRLRVLATAVLCVTLAILVALAQSAPAAGGVTGQFFGRRLASLFGGTAIPIMLMSLTVAASLLLATDFFFYRWFQGLIQPDDGGATAHTRSANLEAFRPVPLVRNTPAAAPIAPMASAAPAAPVAVPMPTPAPAVALPKAQAPVPTVTVPTITLAVEAPAAISPEGAEVADGERAGRGFRAERDTRRERRERAERTPAAHEADRSADDERPQSEPPEAPFATRIAEDAPAPVAESPREDLTARFVAPEGETIGAPMPAPPPAPATAHAEHDDAEPPAPPLEDEESVLAVDDDDDDDDDPLPAVGDAAAMLRDDADAAVEEPVVEIPRPPALPVPDEDPASPPWEDPAVPSDPATAAAAADAPATPATPARRRRARPPEPAAAQPHAAEPAEVDRADEPRQETLFADQTPRADLFGDAVELVITSDRASVSFLQRKLRIRFAEASALLEKMEQQGIIGPDQEGSHRPVLVTLEAWRGRQ